MRPRSISPEYIAETSGAAGLPVDPLARRVLRRHARTAALALRAPEAYIVLRDAPRRVLAATYGRLESAPPGIPGDLEGFVDSGEASTAMGPAVALGATLQTGDGDRLGTLWVRDPDGRRWTRRERLLLRELATSAAEELNLRVYRAAETPGRTATLLSDADELGVALVLHHPVTEPLVSALRRGILTAVHVGRAETGTRLPSIREIAEHSGSTRYAVLQAYRALEAEGIVEMRTRSGVFVASLGETLPAPLPETARWLGRVITESYLHQVKLPSLPNLIRRWTTSTPIRCGCIESSEDYRFALAEEVRTHFGLDAVPIPMGHGRGNGGSAMAGDTEFQRVLASLDVIVTTPFHAPFIRRVAAGLGVPIIVATLDHDSATLPLNRLANGRDLVLICVDAAFGSRITCGTDPSARARVRIVEARSGPQIRRLDRSEPLLMTGAARALLAGEGFRLLAAHYPSFSSRFADRIARTILQLNLDNLRNGA